MKLFIADESPMICARLVTLLSDVEGVSIVGYSLDVISAMPVISAARPDVILLGSCFPRVKVSSLIRFIKLESPASVVIMLADRSDDGSGRYAEAGALRGFDKATELDELIGTIVRMSGGVSPLAPIEHSPEERTAS